MEKELRKKIKREYKKKHPDKKYSRLEPRIENLDIIQGEHIVVFENLKQLLEWYLGKRICGVMDKEAVLMRGKNIDEIYWVSIPMLIARKDKIDKWKSFIENHFTIGDDELHEIWDNRHKPKKGKKVIEMIIRTFEEYKEHRVFGLQAKKTNTLKMIEMDDTKYFSYCDSKIIEVKY